MLLHKGVLLRHYQWSAAQSIMDILKSSGYEAYLAGGCVRDALLGRRPHDLDIATNALPEQVEALFEKTIAVGKAFGVIRVLIHNCDIEVATFRQDGNYLDGRRPESVVFSNIKEDSLRRDFTINAMFLDVDKDEVLDFVGGVDDLEAQLIRAVGDPLQRFEEDKLRMLRAVRFAAQLGFDIDSGTLKAIKQKAFQIQQVSGERIHEELAKFFVAPWRVTHLSLLKASGLEGALFPQLNRKNWIDLPVQSFEQGLCLYLYEDLQNPQVEVYLNQLKLSLKERKFFDHFAKTWLNERDLKGFRQGLLLQMYQEPGVRWAFQLKAFLNFEEFQKDLHLKWLDLNEQLPKPYLTGHAVLQLKKLEGKFLGKLLQEAYCLQLEGVLGSEDDALKWVQTQI